MHYPASVLFMYPFILSYLQDHISHCAPKWHDLSSEQDLHLVPIYKQAKSTTAYRCVFPVEASNLWNALQEKVRKALTHTTFCKLGKAELFKRISLCRYYSCTAENGLKAY